MSKKITRREFVYLSAAAAGGTLLAACQPSQPAPAAPAAPVAQQPGEAPAATWPRGAVPRERSLIRMFGDPEYTNIGIQNGYATGFTHQTSHAIHLEPMFYYTALNDKTYTHLAESYEYNADATELTIKLRRGVEWSDGAPFTAKDIAFTYNQLVARAPDLRDSSRIKTLTEEVFADDDFTVRFVMTKPNYRYHDTECTYRFDRGVYIVPEHVYKDVEGDWREFRFDVSENPEWPVVTGAYKIAMDTPTARHFDLRDDWWAIKTGFIPRPEVERIVQIGFSDDTIAAQRIINNEIDEPLDLRPRTVQSILDQAPHVTTYVGREKPYGYVDWWPISMFFNTLEEPYDDPRVRWAVALCVDQEQLVDVGWDGAGSVTEGPFPHYPGLMRYIESIDDVLREYNPLEVNLEKSAALMQEAGFTKDGQGFWVNAAGQRPNADIYAGVPLFGDIAPVTAEQLIKGGFDAKHVTPPDVWDAKTDGRAYLHFFGHGGSVGDPFTTLDMYHIREQQPTGVSCGDNRPRWGNQEYSDIVDELSQTPIDSPKTFDLFKAAMTIWYRELPEVPLVQWYHRTPINTTYWDNWPTKENLYNSSLWHLTMPITVWNLKAKR